MSGLVWMRRADGGKKKFKILSDIADSITKNSGGHMLKIVLMLNGKELKTLETEKDEITIGRSENSDIHINNLGASSEHARIFRRFNEYILEDLRSTNGTMVNEERIITAKLSRNDVVTIAKHKLLISFQDEQYERNVTEGFADATIKIKP
jgi:pSer/pThr/pTyr-binding forkhead associated (FHA) protein